MKGTLKLNTASACRERERGSWTAAEWNDEAEHFVLHVHHRVTEVLTLNIINRDTAWLIYEISKNYAFVLELLRKLLWLSNQ